jgi:carbamoyltransferase
VCITGGGALNVVLNQRIKNEFDLNLFVSPNPNDCGLSLGAIFLHSQHNNKIDITYNGLPILDKEKLEYYIKNKPFEKFSYSVICEKLKEGKILGVILNDSEVGPRALGNRSIICDPSFVGMKDTLNHKVKFREWYRPFAPFCLEEEAGRFFESKNFENFEFMSYAPLVKKEYIEKLPSITHFDKSSRLQTVSEGSNYFFYNLLKKFSEYSDCPVLLNTSFNIRGNPILSTYEDAFFVLENTELDILVTEDYIIYKN